MLRILDPYILVSDIGPGVLLLCLVAGALQIWKQTKGTSAMAQLIAGTGMFISWVLVQLRLQTTTPFDTSLYSRALQAEPTQIATTLMLIICSVIFSVGYVCYATGLKRI